MLIFAYQQLETMAKTKVNKFKIKKEEIYKLNRANNRLSELENGRVNHHKAHKMATDYNRQKYKQFKNED